MYRKWTECIVSWRFRYCHSLSMVRTNTHYITTESIHYESVMFYCTNTIRGSIVVNMSKEPRQVQQMWHFANDCSAIYVNEIRFFGCDGNGIKTVLFCITLSKDLRQVQLCGIFADDCSVIYANVNETKTRGQAALTLSPLQLVLPGPWFKSDLHERKLQGCHWQNDTKLHLPWFLGCDGNRIKIVLFCITLS
jgi:hypothetical protein